MYDYDDNDNNHDYRHRRPHPDLDEPLRQPVGTVLGAFGARDDTSRQAILRCPVLFDVFFHLGKS